MAMADPRARSLRSWLYVPGDREKLLDGAFSRGADAVILDLEDAVAPDRKLPARQLVARALADAPHDGSPSVWVRVNADDVEADVTAVAHPALAGVVLAKADLDRLAGLDRLLTAAEAALDIGARLAVVPLIETARGLAEVSAIARAHRVRNLALGEADLAAELGIDQRDGTVIAVVRMPLVVASAAAGILAPTGPTSTDYRDMEALRASTRALVRQGFRARSAIHPAQVGVINDVLTPSPADVADARAQVTAFEAAGGGAARGADGIMVDAATVRAARDVLARAAAAGITGP
jgi:citrate lyase subunit beta/citryl-CoA lyase